MSLSSRVGKGWLSSQGSAWPALLAWGVTGAEYTRAIARPGFSTCAFILLAFETYLAMTFKALMK